MRYVVLSVLAVIASACAACGSSDPSQNPGDNTTACVVTLSGAVTASNVTCTADGGFTASNGKGAIAISVGSVNGYAVSAGVGFSHVVTTGTYASTDAGVTDGAAEATATNGNAVWAATKGASNDQGTFTANITSVETLATQQDGSAVYQVHGTFNATMPAVIGTSATGTTTLSATF